MEIFDFVGELNLEESAALEVEVAFADYQDILTFPDLPDLETAIANEEYVNLGTSVFVMKEGKQFHKFEGSLEKNSFSSTLGGQRGALSFENTLTVSKNAINKHIIGWMRANRNRQLIAAFKFLGDQQYTVIGWNKLWAEITSGTMETAPEVQGDKSSNFTVRSIYYPPMWIDAIPFTPGAAPAP